MKGADMYGNDDDVPIDTIITTNDISHEENTIQNIDPLVQPLFDTDELKTNENDPKKFDNL